jgi:hypothetical protein
MSVRLGVFPELDMRRIKLARHPAARSIVAVALALAAAGALAQARLSDDQAAAASPLAPVLERLDDALRQAVTAGDDAASHFLSAELSTLDLVGQARDYAAAAARDPAEPLYAASLARLCAVRAHPSLPACDTRDSIAYWASRDPDNAVPWLLLAERARQRRTPTAVSENLQRAAQATRYDDYAQRAAPLYYERIRKLPESPGSAIAAAATAQYLARGAGGMQTTLSALCGSARDATVDAVTRACLRIAALMIERAPNAVDRATGAALAAANAPTESGRAVAHARARDIAVARQRCRETVRELESLAASADARAQPAATRWVEDRAKDEIGACERLAAALTRG